MGSKSLDPQPNTFLTAKRRFLEKIESLYKERRDLYQKSFCDKIKGLSQDSGFPEIFEVLDDMNLGDLNKDIFAYACEDSVQNRRTAEFLGKVFALPWLSRESPLDISACIEDQIYELNQRIDPFRSLNYSAQQDFRHVLMAMSKTLAEMMRHSGKIHDNGFIEVIYHYGYSIPLKRALSGSNDIHHKYLDTSTLAYLREISRWETAKDMGEFEFRENGHTITIDARKNPLWPIYNLWENGVLVGMPEGGSFAVYGSKGSHEIYLI